MDPSSNHGYLLWQLTHLMQQRMTRELEELDLNLVQVGVLVHVAAGDSVSTADVARRTLVTPQNASLTTRKLSRLGLLTREPHPTHGRVKVLRLTAKGERMMAEGVSRLAAVEAEMLGGLSKSARAALLRSLKICLATMRDSQEEEGR